MTLPTDPTRGILGDDPLRDEDADGLHRGPFAARVVDLLQHVASETPSAVLALLGPWGSGKTTVLHFTRQRLQSVPDWRVVEFNPWMVSDLPSLVEEFFTTLLTALPGGPRARRLRKAFARYARSVAPLAAPVAVSGFSAERVLLFLGRVLAGDASIEAKRTQVENALRDSRRHILLVADDLDRLHPDELTLFFKLVRLVGRLPNVYYLLAFDETTVLDVLTATQLAGNRRERASAYLEKMVQIRLDLPPVHPRRASEMLDTLLNALLAKYGVALDGEDEARLSRAYHEHMRRHLSEPRQVKRFCGQVEALYPLLAEEVNFVDFALVTFLRAFHPEVVPLLRHHRAELTGTELGLVDKPTPEQRWETWQERLRSCQVPEADIQGVLQLLAQLFLPIKGAQGRTTYGGGEWYENLAKRRGVGSSEYFDRYFHLGVGPDDLPDALVVAALDEVVGGVPGEAWAGLLGHLAANGERVMDKLRRLAPPGAKAAERLLPLLASITDQVPASGLFGRAQIVHRFWCSDLLSAVDPEDTQAFVADIAAAASTPFLLDLCTHAVKDAQEEGQVVSDRLRDICEASLVLGRQELEVQSALPPEETSQVVSLLLDWIVLDPTANVRAWVREQIEHGQWPLPDVLGLFTPLAYMYTGSGLGRPSLGDVSFETVESLVGLDFLAERLPAASGEGDAVPASRLDASWAARQAKAHQAIAGWIRSGRRAPGPTD